MGTCKISALRKFTSVRIITPIRFGRLGSEVRLVWGWKDWLVKGKEVNGYGMYRFLGMIDKISFLKPCPSNGLEKVRIWEIYWIDSYLF